MKYKVSIKNQLDKSDQYEMEVDAAVVFVGKRNIKTGNIDAGMGYAGDKNVLGYVIQTVPGQLQQFIKDVVVPDIKKAEQDGELKKKRPN